MKRVPAPPPLDDVTHVVKFVTASPLQPGDGEALWHYCTSFTPIGPCRYQFVTTTRGHILRSDIEALIRTTLDPTPITFEAP